MNFALANFMNCMIYISGGAPSRDENEVTTTVSAFNLSNNSLEQVVPMINPRKYHSSSAGQSSLAVFFGVTETMGIFESTIEILDLKSGHAGKSWAEAMLNSVI